MTSPMLTKRQKELVDYLDAYIVKAGYAVMSYRAAKAGVIHFTRAAAIDLGQSPGEIVVSAISRNATTGFLSLSRSTVIWEPDEIIRAR